MSTFRIMQKTWRNEDGQTLVFVALCIGILMGVVAMAVDVGLMFGDKQKAQTAADAAAVAGLEELSFGDYVTAGQAIAATNGYTNNQNNVTVAINNPPLYGPHAGNVTYVEAIVTAQKPTYFLNALNLSSLTVSARAVATEGPTDNCLYTLSRTGTDISVVNGVKLDFTGCSVYDASSSNKALSLSNGATLTDDSTNIVGNYSSNHPGDVSPAPTTGVGYVNNPLSYLSPPAVTNCQADPGPTFTSSGTNQLNPGCYNGITITNSVNFNPGLYVVNGALSISGGGDTTGTGVTFYLAPGASLNIAAGQWVNFAAPTSGTWNGILFYQDPLNTTSETIAGGSKSTFTGIMYFPTANLTFTNGSKVSFVSIIAGSVSFSGGTKVSNYALVNPNTPLDVPRLVE